MAKVAKSISIDEDLWYEISRECREKGIGLSTYISQKVTSISTGEKEGVCDIIQLFNNKYLIVNNKLLLMEKDIMHALELKELQKAKELEDLKQKREDIEEKLLKKYKESVVRIKTAGLVAEDVLKLNFEDNQEVFDFVLKHRDKDKGRVFTIEDVRVIHNYHKKEEKDGKGTQETG